MFAFCSACDKPRAPFSGKALSFAGQPSKVGGRVGRAIGLSLLVFGLLASTASVLFFQLLVPDKNIGYAVGLPIALVSVVVSAVLLVSSSRLRRLGSDVERQTRLEALYALAVNRGGTLTAIDAGRALHIDAAQLEALLNELTKTQPEHVSLEFDESGHSFYLFSHAGTRPHPFGAKYRVGSEGRVRVADILGVNGPAETLNDDARSASRNKS
ncbi:MAG: hypothetical protein ABIQ16_03410 [Polyangiaceae bacterium]